MYRFENDVVPIQHRIVFTSYKRIFRYMSSNASFIKILEQNIIINSNTTKRNMFIIIINIGKDFTIIRYRNGVIR